jgi:hypothetical protein
MFGEIMTEEEAQEPELEGGEDGCRATTPTAVEAVEAAVDTMPCVERLRQPQSQALKAQVSL